VSPLDTLLLLIALGGLLSTLTLTVLAVHWCLTASRDRDLDCGVDRPAGGRPGTPDRAAARIVPRSLRGLLRGSSAGCGERLSEVRDLHADAAGGFTAGPRQRLGVSRQLVDERRVRAVLAPRSGDVSNVVPLDERHGGAA
jgi:hypothetical protein